MSKERELPDVLEQDFVICDNTLNRNGWRLFVEGVDISGFVKNPVCLTQHNTWMVAIGKWKNVRVENSQLIGTVEFDKNDEDAVKLYWKYKDGYMNACSIHILPIEESSEPTMMLPGQIYPTVIKSELLEISLVTLPGQKNAVKLCAPDGSDYKLNLIPKKMEEKNENQEHTKNEDALKENKELRAQLEESRKLNATNLVRVHQERGVVAEGEVEPLTELALGNYAMTEKMLNARPAPAKTEAKTDEVEKETQGKQLANQIKNYQAASPSTTADDRSKWNYLDYFKKDPEALSLMEKSEPEKFAKLCADFEASSKKNHLNV